MNHQLKFKNMRTGDKIFDILNYTLLTIIMVVVLYPVLYIVAASFSDPQAVVSGEVFILPVRPTLRGYEAVFKNKKILTGFANSVYYLVVGTLLNLVMTMLCAYPLSRKEFRARGGVAMFFVFTMYFSGGLVPSYILVNSLHLTNTRWAMIIPSAMSTYNMIICRTYMSNSIPDEMYDLRDDTLMPLTIVMKEILIQNKVDMTQIGDASNLAKLQGMSELLKYSTIVVASIPVMLLYPLVQKHLVKGVMIGAVKG